MYTYIDTHVCLCIHAGTHEDVRMCLWKYAYMSVGICDAREREIRRDTYIRISIPMHVYSYVRVGMDVGTEIWACIHVYIYMCIHIHVYIYIYIYICIYIHIYTCRWRHLVSTCYHIARLRYYSAGSPASIAAILTRHEAHLLYMCLYARPDAQKNVTLTVGNACVAFCSIM